MNIVEEGAGTVGVQIALALLANESMVVLIEVDLGRASTVTARGLTVVTGDAGVSKTLEEAGGLRADVLVACTGQDAENLVISLLARGDLVVAVIRHGRSTPPVQAGPLRSGDRVLVITDPDGEDRAHRAFYPDDPEDPVGPATATPGGSDVTDSAHGPGTAGGDGDG